MLWAAIGTIRNLVGCFARSICDSGYCSTGVKQKGHVVRGTAIKRLSRLATAPVRRKLTDSASPFYGHGHRIAAAQAKGCDPTMGIAANHLVH